MPHTFPVKTEDWFGNSDIFPQTLKGANNSKTPTKKGVTYYVKIHLKIPPIRFILKNSRHDRLLTSTPPSCAAFLVISNPLKYLVEFSFFGLFKFGFVKLNFWVWA